MFTALKNQYGGCCAICANQHTEYGDIIFLDSSNYAVCSSCGEFSKGINSLSELKEKLIEALNSFKSSVVFQCVRKELKDISIDKIYIHFESYLDPNAPIEEKLKRNTIKDANFIHKTLFIRFLNHNEDWWFWSYEDKQWVESKDRSKDILVVPYE